MAQVLTNAGKAIISNRVKGGGTEPSYVAWGTGAGTAAVTDTTLFTEAAEARVACTTTQQTENVTNDTYQAVGTITSSSAQTITNAGLFDASTGGNLFVKADFTGVPLSSSESIQFTFRVTFA